MGDEDLKQKLRTAFAMGFLASCEGFNPEVTNVNNYPELSNEEIDEILNTST